MKKFSLSFILGLAMFSLAHQASATVLYWDGSTSNITTNGDGISYGGAGIWNTTIQNWDQGAGLPHIVWDNTQNYDAYFAGLTNIVTLGTAITANSVTFNTTNGYVISDGGNSANTLTLNYVTNASAAAISANVVNSTAFNVYGSSGTLTMTNVSAGLTGPLIVNAGSLKLGDDNNNGPTGFSSASISNNATLLIEDAVSASYGQSFSGAGTLSVNDKSSSIITTLTAANSYTNKTIVNQATLSVANVDETDPNCNIGTGPLQIGNGSSATTFTYAYPGGTITTLRPLIFGGTASPSINNVSSGTLTLAGPVSFAANATTPKAIKLSGNLLTVFASSIPDNITATTTNATSLQVNSSSTWLLTGSNTYSGGITFLGGSTFGILMLTNDAALGAVTNTITLTTNGSAASSGGKIASMDSPVTLGATRTITFGGPNANGEPTADFYTTDTNSLTVASYITGGGNVTRTGSSYAFGAVRFSNDTNNFTGAFTAGYGATEFTSVAASGTVCSLGMGITNSGAIVIANSTSSGTLRYVGSTNSSTTRALNWTATTGGYALDASGSGTIAYLAGSSLKSGSGSATLTLQGTNTGTNTLVQVINDEGGTTALSKSGAGKWVLAGANAFGGSTTVSSGTLSVSQDANLGTAPGSATPNSLILNGGALSASASFALNANRGIALGPTSGTGSGTVDVASGQTLTYAGIAADNGGSGSLNKTGIGKLTLSGANTYSGNTTINAGTLALTGSGTIGSGTNLIINAGGMFDVSGLGGGYTLAAYQVLLATNVATATVNGSLNVASAAVEMTNVINTPTINVTGGALTLGSGLVFTVNVGNGGSPLGAGSYKLISKGSGGSVSGTAPATVTVGGDGLAGGATASLSISNNELYLVVSGGTLYPPAINSFSLIGGQAVLSFNGTNGQTWRILATTNLTVPRTDWTQVTNGTFTGTTVNYTNPSPIVPQQFYMITSP